MSLLRYGCIQFCLATCLVSIVARAESPPEFRGLWADTFHAGMRNRTEVTALVTTARRANFNAIIVEVRKRGDAYYNSSFEPKATDVSPQDFDPLADLIAQAHGAEPRLEVHAWITTYLVWNQPRNSPTQRQHPFNLHRDWLTQNYAGAKWDGDNYQFEPSHPLVQKHIYNVAMDIVSRYDVDGLHFDYVRYSGTNWGYHPVAIDRFRRRHHRTDTPNPLDAQWRQFRRDQVTGLVRKVYLNAAALKPLLKLSASTISFAPGITNDAQWFSSASAWNNVLQDWRGWMEEGILDLNVPMLYFDQRRYATDWARWSLFAKEHAYGHHVALGQGAYLNTLANTLLQLRTTRLPSRHSNAAAGMALFSYALPVTNDTSSTKLFSALIQRSSYDPHPTPLFAEPVPSPVMTWKTAPMLGHLKGTIRDAQRGQELDGAIISLDGPMPRVQTNDATGFYGFAHLTPGNYTITAIHSNRTAQSEAVEITAGVVRTLDFQLAVPKAVP